MDHFGLEELAAVYHLLTAGGVAELLSGPDRAYLLVVFEGNVPMFSAVFLDPPDHEGATALWEAYTVGKTAPVVMARDLPAPLTTFFAALLPGVEGEGCPDCGVWPLPPAHRCPAFREAFDP